MRAIITKSTMSVMAKLVIACRCEDQEAKQLLNNSDVPDGFSVVAQAPACELARSVTEYTHAKIRQIREPDADLETTQAEVNRGYGVTVKLESLCPKLQNQTNSSVEERKQLTEI